jgi:DNA invertase Pin-like site-specific DNA recombinase
MPQPRDVVVVRVSHQGDREDDHFHSPEVQADAAKRYAKQRRERIIAPPFREIDVSGKLPLARRPGLLAAIELVEAGKADHILVAYFDRLVRSLKVQLEVIERVEKAGGEIFALDHGKLTNGTAATRLSTNMLGAVFQYFAEITGEKVTAGQARAVAHGIYPNPRCPPGLRKRPDGVLEPDPKLAPVIVEAYKRRDRGATLREVQALLAEHGVERAIGGVNKILSSRLYLGEIHFGELHNLKAHKPVIKDRDLFERVQRRRAPRGRQAKSERLLARLGVLRCGGCGSLMVMNSWSGSYRCGNMSARGCPRKAGIKAHQAEQIVMDRVREHLADARGRASHEQRIREADERIERAQAALDAAIRAFTGLEGEGAAVERLTELRQTRDRALDERADLGPEGPRKIVAPADIEKLRDPAKRLEAWRRLIAATVVRATVEPATTADGRRPRAGDPGRVTVEFVLRQ